MNNANQPHLSVHQLKDNRFDEPKDNNPDDIKRIISAETEKSLKRYAGKSLNQWAELGVIVFPAILGGQKANDDEADKLNFFTLGYNQDKTQTWVNTGNCMGVVRLRDKNTGTSVQIEIGSRFDEGKNQFFLTYLLSKVFGGSMVDPKVAMGQDSLWDMLLACVLRRRLLEARAVGLFKQFQTFKHNDTRIRGRIDLNEHLRRNVPFYGKMAYSTHEITFNNPTNHLIRHALAKASRKWGWLLTGDGVMDVRHDLEQNTPTWQPGDVTNCVRRKENRTPVKHPFFHAAYEPLRQVSLAILRDEGASLYQQHHEADGVIFDGAWLWEEYLWTLLKPLDFKHPENKKKTVGWQPLAGIWFYPDFFHEGKRVVLDAKYARGGVRQEHARQLFCYMFLLNAIHGGLIKPDVGQEKCEYITRKDLKADKAKLHDFFLAPPAKDTFKDAREFKAKMRASEEIFQTMLCETLK